MRKIILLSLLLSLAGLLFACATSADKQGRERAKKYTLVYLKTGPQSGKLSEADNRQAFDGHFSNMTRLAQEHKLVVAGPFGKERHDPNLRGLFVINSAEREQATEWAWTDPAAKAGVFELEFHDFETTAPLVAMLDRVLEIDEQAKAENRTVKPGDGVRPYVLLGCLDGEIAQRELALLQRTGGVLLLARVDGSQAFALLDAKDVADARLKYAAAIGRIGD